MIESRYWRPGLVASARRIAKLSKFKRWSEKRMCLLEREVIIAMSCIRILVERDRMSRKLRERKHELVAFPKKSARRTTYYTIADLEDLYDFKRPASRHLTLEEISNQFIHHFIIFAESSDVPRRFSTIVVASDWSKEKYLFRIELNSITAWLKELSESYLESGWTKVDIGR